MITRHFAVVFVGFVVALFPVLEYAARHSCLTHPLLHAQLRLVSPQVDEVDDLLSDIMRNPATRTRSRFRQLRCLSCPAWPPAWRPSLPAPPGVAPRAWLLEHPPSENAVSGPHTPLGAASHRVLVHRFAVSLPASFPRSVTLPQLRFASLRMTSSWPDLHRQGCAPAGCTRQNREKLVPFGVPFNVGSAALRRLENGSNSASLF